MLTLVVAPRRCGGEPTWPHVLRGSMTPSRAIVDRRIVVRGRAVSDRPARRALPYLLVRGTVLSASREGDALALDALRDGQSVRSRPARWRPQYPKAGQAAELVKEAEASDNCPVAQETSTEGLHEDGMVLVDLEGALTDREGDMTFVAIEAFPQHAAVFQANSPNSSWSWSWSWNDSNSDKI
jgi:hypothetical protein